jgi:flagellar motility protein MotE (MotC chaperone)
LSVKVSDVWRGLGHVNTAVAVSETKAQTAAPVPQAQPTTPVQAQQTQPSQPIGQVQPGQQPAQPRPGQPAAAQAQAPTQAPPAPAAGQAPAGAPARAAGAPPAAAPAPRGQPAPAPAAKTAAAPGSDKPLDPILFSQSEIELLQNLSTRRKEIDQREQEVKQREVLLAAAEKRLEGKIAELKDVQTQIEGLIRKYNAQQEAEIKRLVTIYEGMKPKDAARIFDQLDLTVLLGILERMRESKSSPIIAQMTPERAKEITTQIAQRRDMPTLKQ